MNLYKSVFKNVSIRISSISSSEEIFKEAAVEYSEALEKSGFTEKMEYYPQKQNKSKKNRRKKAIWYNPTYSMSSATNIAKSFFVLLDRHFHTKHKLYKIFNRRTIKLSYATAQNIAQTIAQHNQKIINKNRQINEEPEEKCNCRRGAPCPLNGNCMAKELVYKATVNLISKDDPYMVVLCLLFPAHISTLSIVL